MLARTLFIACLATVLSCTSKRDNALFQKLSPGKTGIDFINQLDYSDSLSVLEFVYMFNGAGVALIDINNDNLQDILFTGNMVPARLYLNKGNLEFEDITQKAGINTDGWMNGVAVVDINQDGYQDFYICKSGNYRSNPKDMRNLFFINNKNNTFTESAAKIGLDEDGCDVQSAFFDYDKDGDLDMYLMRNAMSKKNPSNTRPEAKVDKKASIDKLFRNNGDLTFTDVSEEAGINIEGFGLGLIICDINNDNWPDVYVSNDFSTSEEMWINNQNGTFTNRAKECLRHETYNGMGNDIADFNNDGLPDIMVVDMLPPDNKRWKLTMMGNAYDEFQQNLLLGYDPQYVRNTLQLNNGDGTFSDIGMLAGVHATEWSWAPLFADFDNDGWKDLFISNGFRQDINNLDFIFYGYNMYGKKENIRKSPEEYRRDRLKKLKELPGIKVHSYLYKNERNLRFSDVSTEWGMGSEAYSNGTAYGDLDNDGDLDLVINTLDERSVIYENKTSQRNAGKSWLRIKFNGPNGNRDGLNTKVWIWQNGKMQYNYFTPYRGYLSSMEQLLHFGVEDAAIDSLKVLWPDGKQQLLKLIKQGELLALDYNNATINQESESSGTRNTLFTVAANFGIQYKHVEDYFVDFKLQPLLPHMHSRQGPGIAVGDINGDGREDFYVGGALGSSGRIYLQQHNGKFIEKVPGETNKSDDMGVLLFDADNDGDNDLYIASGGTSQALKGSLFYKHRLYINDAKGNFHLLADGLPQIVTAASGVKAADYDRDGDLDLFVCGRVSPGEYPHTPKSFLLRNDTKDGKCAFTDITDKNIAEAGMISDALWTDFNNDGWVDLVAVGEFMPLKFFKNDSGRLRDVSNETGLTNTNGWWNSLTGGDFDKDGDIDYVAGNLGLNGPYKVTGVEPVCVYASDYDKNGRVDPILCHFIGGNEYMVHSRDDINRQMTAMRSRFRSYNAYATATFREAMREDEIAKAFVLKANRFENTYIENVGGGKFKMHALPLEAQLSPLFGMVTSDFDGDGNLDVLCAGNSFSTEVQTGRYDAQGTLFLKGDGKGNFEAERSVLNIGGDNKSLAPININGNSYSLIMGVNSDSLRVFNVSTKSTIIKLLSSDSYAIVTDDNNRQWRVEFYYGHSYLSQGSRSLAVPKGVKGIEIFTFNGQSRKISI